MSPSHIRGESKPVAELQDKFIAFIDILGFRSVVSRLSNESGLRDRFHAALVRLKEEESYRGTFEVTAFSDSIVISSSVQDGPGLLWKCASLQAQMLYTGILLRGGVSRGAVFHADGIVYGEGMVSAYGVESDIANYPRIVIDPAHAAEVKARGNYKTFLLDDEDGLTRVNPFFNGFGIWGMSGTPDEREEDRDSLISDSRRQLQALLGATKDPRALTKIRWLLTKLEEASRLPYVEI